MKKLLAMIAVVVLLAASGLAQMTTGYVPQFTNASGSLANSSIFQLGSNIGIGLTTPSAILHVSTTTPPAAYFDIYSGSPTTALSTMPTVNRAARGTPPGTSPGPSAVQLGDYLAGMAARGYGSTGFASGGRAALRMQAAETWTDQNQGTYMSFWTSATHSTTSVEHMRIDPFGNVGIGTQTPTNLLTVAGVIQSTAGTGTGGGFKFPDGTTQTTAATSGVVLSSPDGSVTVGGTAAAPTVKVNTAMIQASVTGSCPAGSAMSAVNANGTVVCGTIGSGGTLASVPVIVAQTSFTGSYGLARPTRFTRRMKMLSIACRCT